MTDEYTKAMVNRAIRQFTNSAKIILSIDHVEDLRGTRIREAVVIRSCIAAAVRSHMNISYEQMARDIDELKGLDHTSIINLLRPKYKGKSTDNRVEMQKLLVSDQVALEKRIREIIK